MISSQHIYNVLVIGAGPAGLGSAIALKDFGVKDVLVVDKNKIGSSFLHWPKETKLLSPSFTGHQFGLLDLNAITYGTSPAYSLRTEHPFGYEYGDYLRACKNAFKIKVKEDVKIISITKDQEIFVCKTNKETLYTRYIISAVGEFSFPKTESFVGADLCLPTSKIETYNKIKGDSFVIIGGYESGIDAAIHLSRQSKKSIVIDSDSPWEFNDSDPSITLSPFTLDRLREELPKGNITLIPNQKVIGIKVVNDLYRIKTKNFTYTSLSAPLLALGFNAKNNITSELFSFTKEGLPKITDKDESTKVSGVFLVGPKVKHGNVIFCFIYKYRERFAIVANQIATQLNINTEKEIKRYKEKNMYLDDLSCCGDTCTC